MTKGLSGIIGARGSLLRAVVLNVSLALLSCVALATVIMVYEFDEHLQERTEENLLREAQELASQLEADTDQLGLLVGSLRFRSDEGAFRYTIFDAALRPITGQELGDLVPDARRALLNRALTGAVSLPDGRIAVAARGAGETVVLASSIDPRFGKTRLTSLLHELEEQLVWVTVGALILMATAIMAARRIQAPLRRSIDQLQAVAPGSPGIRLQGDHLPNELAPFVKSVNEAFDRLEQGYQAQRDFSSNVAHEVRTPLAILRSTIERIEDRSLRDKLLSDMTRLDRLFGQLIDLARADATHETVMAEVDLHDIALEFAREESLTALRKNRSLAVSGSNLAPMRGHAGLLNVALGNLVRNALNHTPEGSEVEIEVCATPPGWRVLDQGPGVPDNQKAILFDRFQRGSAKSADGAGIGLAIVCAVARAHGGRCWVEDRAGGGSIFAISFPIQNENLEKPTVR